MTVKELREELNRMSDDTEVILEIPVNDVEFCTDIEKIYESGELYIYGKGQKFSIEDAKIWWGVEVIESEDK